MGRNAQGFSSAPGVNVRSVKQLKDVAHDKTASKNRRGSTKCD